MQGELACVILGPTRVCHQFGVSGCWDRGTNDAVVLFTSCKRKKKLCSTDKATCETQTNTSDTISEEWENGRLLQQWKLSGTEGGIVGKLCHGSLHIRQDLVFQSCKCYLLSLSQHIPGLSLCLVAQVISLKRNIQTKCNYNVTTATCTNGFTFAAAKSFQ